MANTDHFGSPEKHDFPLVSDRQTDQLDDRKYFGAQASKPYLEIEKCRFLNFAGNNFLIFDDKCVPRE